MDYIQHMQVNYIQLLQEISISLLVLIHGERHSTVADMSGWQFRVAILHRLVVRIPHLEKLPNLIPQIQVG